MDTNISPFSCQIRNQHPPSPPRRRFSPPPPTTTNLFLHLHDVHHRASYTMPLADLTFRRIATTQHRFRFNHHRANPLSLNPNLASISNHSMADESKKIDAKPEKIVSETNIDLSKEVVKVKETEKPTPALPPPPEKPLPGDCCGSGCVRCVWDVYYEELEEYNKLCKADS